jgi:hypothetical protein
MPAPRTGTKAQWPGLAALGVALFAFILTVLAAAGVSFRADVGPLSISLRHARNPAIVTVVTGLCAVWWLGVRLVEEVTRRVEAWARQRADVAALALAVGTAVGTARHGAFVAAGSDSAGYLSQARLWLSGSLHVTPAVVPGVSFREGLRVVTPLGFTPAVDGTGTIVPTYPPGLPVLMAFFHRTAGPGAEFWVVPLAAGILVLTTYRVGRQVAGPLAGLIAAAATASSPTMLFQALQPMSDVPAAAAWMTAVSLLMRPGVPSSAAAAAAGTAACFIRPNLVAMVPLLALAAWWWEPHVPRRRTRAVISALPAALAGFGFAWLQSVLYGRPTATGYGELASMFSLDHIQPNLTLFPQWLFETHGIFVFLGLAAPQLLGRRAGPPDEDSPLAASASRWAVLMCLALLTFYLCYLPFDGWPYTRFLLPVLPLAFALSAATTMAALGRLPRVLHTVALVSALVLLPLLLLSRARDLGVFGIQHSEQRYLDAARYVDSLPASAVFLCLQHSGSLAFYTGRPILRWDWVQPGELDEAVAHIAATGRAVYAVLDEWEERELRARFPESRLVAALSSPAFTSAMLAAVTTRVYLVQPAS